MSVRRGFPQRDDSRRRDMCTLECTGTCAMSLLHSTNAANQSRYPRELAASIESNSESLCSASPPSEDFSHDSPTKKMEESSINRVTSARIKKPVKINECEDPCCILNYSLGELKYLEFYILTNNY